MYCITLNDTHYEKIKNLGYIPVGLGSNIKNKNFQNDKTGENISSKNPYYGEYTFHYWIWKNEIENIKNEWIGFCQYRKFWSLENNIIEYRNLSELKKNIVINLPDIFQSFESVLGDPIFINQFKLSKFLKKNFFKILKNLFYLLDSKKRNIKFPFDLKHGEGKLEKAID